MFSKILIANRGEIAVRVIRACKEMGISTVAVYSEQDSQALHVAMADQAVCIGEAAADKSYLNQNNIISAAKITGAQAIHPCYGFLSENPEFAGLCEKHGIVFIGPSAKVIHEVGDKEVARKIMKEHNVPIVPGTEILPTVDDAILAADEIGYPVIIKARAGGGGKGIRIVYKKEDLPRAYNTATREAESAFGDGGVYMEKFLEKVKHIETQLLADEAGNVVCLGERECSIQQNNQKLIEEAPSSAVTPEVREKLFAAAKRAASAVGYTNAGTIEFLMDTQGNFYFMEMNARLQVEHPVTEFTTDIDIVKWQIRIASGVPLRFKQEDIVIRGHSMECRINAKGVGKIEFLHVPSGPGVRFDSYIYQGYEMSPFYDSMMGKLIVYAHTREEVIRKMQSALCELVVEGVPNNIELQLNILANKDFRNGNYFIDFMKTRGV